MTAKLTYSQKWPRKTNVVALGQKNASTVVEVADETSFEAGVRTDRSALARVTPVEKEDRKDTKSEALVVKEIDI